MASEVNFSQEIDTLQRQLRSSKATQKKVQPLNVNCWAQPRVSEA